MTAGLPADFLIGGGCVDTIYASYVGLEKFGLAPNFRKAIEKGAIKVKECCEVYMVYGLQAGAATLPFCALPKGHQETSLLSVNPDYRIVKDPYTGEEVVTIPPLIPAPCSKIPFHRSPAFRGQTQLCSKSTMNPFGYLR